MHSIYYNQNGKEVPSVTTILKAVNKPQLVQWAHFMGTRHVDIDALLDDSAFFGNCIHDYLESYFNHGYYIPIEERLNIENYKKAVNNFKWFMKGKTFETIMTETARANELYGGTLDFYGVLDGKKLLIDFKTSKQVYSTYLLQLGGYYGLIKDEVDVEGAAILIVNAKKCMFYPVTLEQLEMYKVIFDKLVDFYIYYTKIEKVD